MTLLFVLAVVPVTRPAPCLSEYPSWSVKAALLAIKALFLAALFQLRNPIGARHDAQR